MVRRMTQKFLLFALPLSLALASTPALAEMYVAGQVGVSMPKSLQNIQGTDSFSGVSFSDLSLQDSFIYGAKLGYYFDSMKWLGLETEVFNSTPHVKSQTVTAKGPGGSLTDTIDGIHQRVLNWSPVIIVVRHQMGQFEPYAGIGMGVFFSNLTTGGESSSSTAVGITTQLGLRYLVTQNVSIFGEWKYNQAKFNYSETQNNIPGVKADYIANILAFGVGYHF